MTAPAPLALTALADVARGTPGLQVLLLFGSRARGDAAPHSDWDLGYLADDVFDFPGFLARVVTVVGTDRVDLVDLSRANGLLRYRAARDGQLVFEARLGLGDAFRLEAAQFWCDAGPVLERGYEAVLADLRP